MSSDGRQATDAGFGIRAGSYPGVLNMTSPTNDAFAESRPAREAIARADRRLVAVPAGEPAVVDCAQEPSKRARSINRRLVGLACIDIAAATTAAAVAFAINAGAAPWHMAARDPSVLALPPALLVLVALNGGYDGRDMAGGHDELMRVFRAYLNFAVLVAVTSYATHAYFARSFLLVAVPLALAFDLTGRIAARRWSHGRRARGRPVRAALAVGDARAVTAFAEALEHDRSGGIAVRGTCLIDGRDDDLGLLDARRAGDGRPRFGR